MTEQRLPGMTPPYPSRPSEPATMPAGGHDRLSEQQFGQLPMFMSAREIRQTHRPLPYDFHPFISTREHRIETTDEFWKRTSREAEETGLTEHAAEGMGVPAVHLATKFGRMASSDPRIFQSRGGPTIVGGHHRIAAYSEVDPDRPLTVHHHTDWDAAMDLKDLTEVGMAPQREAALRKLPSSQLSEGERNYLHAGWRYT